MRLALLVIAAVGCGRVNYDRVLQVDDGGTMIDAKVPEIDAADDGLPDLPLNEAVPIAELASPAFQDDDPTLTGDLLEMYFNSERVPSAQVDIYVTTRDSVDEPWGTPTSVVEFNTNLRETNCDISVDGLDMYFSRSAGTGQPFLLMHSERSSRSSAWSTPLAVDELNTFLPSSTLGLVSDTSATYGMFQVGDLSEGYAIYETDRSQVSEAWSPASPLTGLNASNYTMSPSLDGEGRTVIFESDRTSGDVSKADLFISKRATREEPFATATALSLVNTEFDESDAWLHPSRRLLVFKSDRSGSDDLWVILFSDPL